MCIKCFLEQRIDKKYSIHIQYLILYDSILFYEIIIFLNTVDKIVDQENKGTKTIHNYFCFKHFVNFLNLMSNNLHKFVYYDGTFSLL